MCDNTSDAVHQSILDTLHGYPLFGPDAELFPENAHPSSICFYPRLVLDPPDSGTSIGAIPDNSRIQSLTAGWHASAMCQRPSREPSAPNELAVSYRSEMYEDLVMKRRPVFMAPTIPQIKLLDAETLHDQSGILPLSSRISPGVLEESTSESLSQADSVSPSQECYALWKKIPVDAIVAIGSNKFVPQTLYRPFTEADKERYIERVSLSAPIIFVTKEPLEWGISLEDVRNGKTKHLMDKDVAVLQDCGPSVSIRVNWPGYPPFKRSISSRNWRRMKGPITKEKLAQNLAKIAGRFIEVGYSRKDMQPAFKILAVLLENVNQAVRSRC